MKLKYFNPKEKQMVGSYKPTPAWSQYTHFAVMEEKSCGLQASVGFFQRLNKREEWSFEDYDQAAASIEQGQLYAHAVEMFELIDRMKDHVHPDIQEQANNLLHTITDISETATRLLGDNAMLVIDRSN